MFVRACVCTNACACTCVCVSACVCTRPWLPRAPGKLPPELPVSSKPDIPALPSRRCGWSPASRLCLLPPPPSLRAPHSAIPEGRQRSLPLRFHVGTVGPVAEKMVRERTLGPSCTPRFTAGPRRGEPRHPRSLKGCGRACSGTLRARRGSSGFPLPTQGPSGTAPRAGGGRRPISAAGGGAPAPLPASPPARCPRPSAASPLCGDLVQRCPHGVGPPAPAASPHSGPSWMEAGASLLSSGRRCRPPRTTTPRLPFHLSEAPRQLARPRTEPGCPEVTLGLCPGGGESVWKRKLENIPEWEHCPGSRVPPSLDAQRAP